MCLSPVSPLIAVRPQRFIFYPPSQLHNLSTSQRLAADIMLAKAIKEHNPVSSFKPSTSSDRSRKAVNALTSASTTALNSSSQFRPTKTNPLKRTATQANVTELPRNRKDIKRSLVGLANMAQLERVGKLHETVYFDENDFVDDADIDLDADESPSLTTSFTTAISYPPLPTVGQIAYPLLPPLGLPPLLPPSKSPSSPKHSHPPSSASIPWSSSPVPAKPPPSHADLSKKPSKRRNLPWQKTQEAEENNALAHQNRSTDRNASHEGHDFDKYSYTPLPNEKPYPPYPWNKTAGAVKEEQKRLRQGNKKLVRDNEADEATKKFTLAKRKNRVAEVYLSDEQKKVLNLVTEEKKSVFFTGSAGTGKSVLLREIIKNLRVQHNTQPDRVAVTASTGLAACNVSGVTLHSFAGIGLGKEEVTELVRKIKRNQKAKSRWLRTKVLIIDEISMVDGDLFDKLESIARIIRSNGRPFGGIQLVITGDFFQLPPVPDQGKIAKFSFDAATWNTSIEHTIGLTQVFRQKDPGIVSPRHGSCTINFEQHLQICSTKCD